MAPWNLLFVVGCYLSVLACLVAIARYAREEGDTESASPGMGFWDWNVHKRLGTWWHGIPLYNYAAWFAAPVFLVAFARLLGWIRRFLGLGRGDDQSPPTLVEGSFLIIILIAALILVYLSPRNAENLPFQVLVLVVLVLGTLAWTVLSAPTFDTRNEWRWEFIVPQAFMLLFPFLALLFNGLASEMPSCVVVGVVILALGGFFAIWPYIAYGGRGRKA